MALEVVWTRRAEIGYDRIIRYLEKEWSAREIRNFIDETRQFLELLKRNPRLLEPSQIQKNTYRGPMNRLTIVTYRIRPRKHQVELLNIRGSKQMPFGG